jgi:hypothetical protein
MPIYSLVDIVTVLLEEKSSRNIVSKGNEKVWMQKVVENSRIRINSILNKNKGDREAKTIKFGHLVSAISTGPELKYFICIWCF